VDVNNKGVTSNRLRGEEGIEGIDGMG